MEVIIKGKPKEIAALVLAVQERQGPMYTVAFDGSSSMRDKEALANTIKSVLSDTSEAQSQPQQHDSTSHTESQDEEPHSQEPAP